MVMAAAAAESGEKSLGWVMGDEEVMPLFN
jgi:hypothetical protein